MAGHPSTGGNVNIGNDVWIGHGVTLISGVSIGNGAVIAANSNVVKDVGDYEVVGGNPAQRIKSRFNENIIAKLIELKWWDLDCDQIKDITPFLCSLPNEAIIDDFIAKYRKQYI